MLILGIQIYLLIIFIRSIASFDSDKRVDHEWKQYTAHKCASRYSFFNNEYLNQISIL